MSIAHHDYTAEDAMVLSVLEALLAADWNPTCVPSDADHPSADNLADPAGVSELELPFWRAHVTLNREGVAEAQIEIDDGDEASVLVMLRRHLGPGIEIGQMHRRIHRWLVDGREVLLDSFNGRSTCLRIA